YFHAYNAETGRHVWTARLGNQTARALPASVNSSAVFVTNFNKLFALHRTTGVPYWSTQLNALPSSGTACDEERVMVALISGKVFGYGLTVKDEKGNSKISDQAIDIWNWQTGGPVHTRPLLAKKLIAFGSDDGKLYVAMSEERTMLFRLTTGGPI